MQFHHTAFHDLVSVLCKPSCSLFSSVVALWAVTRSGVARIFKWGGGADSKKRAHVWCMNDMTCEGMHIVLSVLIHVCFSIVKLQLY